jgi:hypothetical protein
MYLVMVLSLIGNTEGKSDDQNSAKSLFLSAANSFVGSK